MTGSAELLCSVSGRYSVCPLTPTVPNANSGSTIDTCGCTTAAASVRRSGRAAAGRPRTLTGTTVRNGAIKSLLSASPSLAAAAAAAVASMFLTPD